MVSNDSIDKNMVSLSFHLINMFVIKMNDKILDSTISTICNVCCFLSCDAEITIKKCSYLSKQKENLRMTPDTSFIDCAVTY